MTFTDSTTSQRAKARYEYRVWGDTEVLRYRLSCLAEEGRRERVEDCYLLVNDRGCNVKIRNDRLKVKRLVDERFGFQRWMVQRNSSTPGPSLHEPAPSSRAVPFMADADQFAHAGTGLPAVRVFKERQRYRVGSVRAEAVVAEVIGRPGRLTSVAIEGRDLADLMALATDLGVDTRPNVAFHLAIEPWRNEPWHGTAFAALATARPQ